MNKNKGKKIAIAGNHKTTIDLVKGLQEANYKVNYILNMSNDLNGEISGYVNLEKYAKKNKIKIIRPTTYSLSSKEDISLIKPLGIDLLLVFGWQRLIPEWLLNSLSLGAFGVHGSWRRLPYGRGRSVGIWGIILGKKRILSNLFMYDKGADSGDILDTQEFSLTCWDTVSSLHHKDQLIFQGLLIKYLPKILMGTIKLRKQPKKKEVFFPKRSPEDGIIDWRWNSIEIFNLIRAISKPYPGAFTFHGDNKVMIWKAIPFDPLLLFKARPGQIIAVFEDNTFVVKTKDSTLLIEEYESNWRPKVGAILKSGVNYSFIKLKKQGINEKI